MRVTFNRSAPAEFPQFFTWGVNTFTRSDMVLWLHTQPEAPRYFKPHAAYSYETGRTSWGRRQSDGRRCLVKEMVHVPAGVTRVNLPSLATLAKMRAKRDGFAAVVRGDGTVFAAAFIGGKLVTRTGLAD